MEELLTVREVARYCKVHEITVRRHIASGLLPSVRVGRAVRVRAGDLERFASDRQRRHELTASAHADLELPADDPLWNIVGLFDHPGLAGVATDKYRAVAEAYSDKR